MAVAKLPSNKSVVEATTACSQERHLRLASFCVTFFAAEALTIRAAFLMDGLLQITPRLVWSVQS